jgi:transposase
MKQKTNGKYNKEFKEMVVDLYRSGQPVRSLSSEYGISEVTIYKWIKALTPIKGLEEENMTPADVKELQREILRIKEENEILKKAMTIFAKK